MKYEGVRLLAEQLSRAPCAQTYTHIYIEERQVTEIAYRIQNSALGELITTTWMWSPLISLISHPISSLISAHKSFRASSLMTPVLFCNVFNDLHKICWFGWSHARGPNEPRTAPMSSHEDLKGRERDWTDVKTGSAEPTRKKDAGESNSSQKRLVNKQIPHESVTNNNKGVTELNKPANQCGSSPPCCAEPVLPHMVPDVQEREGRPEVVLDVMYLTSSDPASNPWKRHHQNMTMQQSTSEWSKTMSFTQCSSWS